MYTRILRYLQPKFRDKIIKPCGSAMWSDLKSDSPLDFQALLWDVQGVFPKASMKNCKYASRNRSDNPGHSLSPVGSPDIENALIFCSSCFQEEMRCSHNITRSTILSFECPYQKHRMPNGVSLHLGLSTSQTYPQVIVHSDCLS